MQDFKIFSILGHLVKKYVKKMQKRRCATQMTQKLISISLVNFDVSLSITSWPCICKETRIQFIWYQIHGKSWVDQHGKLGFCMGFQDILGANLQLHSSLRGEFWQRTRVQSHLDFLHIYNEYRLQVVHISSKTRMQSRSELKS